MVKRFLFVIFIVCLSIGLTSPAFAYEVNLTIPQYGQELSYWSGPACAQMILNGYPDPYPSIYYTQAEIWTCIQSHNSGEPGWATDPEGMQGALIELNPPPPGTTWGLNSFDIREDLMFRILYWMNYNSFAVTTLVNSGYHWVDVVGYVTDIEPLWGTDPELQEITIHNPWPVGSGEISTMTGTVWYDTMWEHPVENPGTWQNKYVAIIEPPEIEGGVIVRRVVRRGTTAILAADALQFSQTWIEQLNLDLKDPSYAALTDTDTQYLEPILVREEINFNISKDERVPYYYIIPYAAKNDNVLSANKSESKPEYSSISVIVNAFTGDFEQVSSFGTPIKYITEEEAIKAAAGFLKLKLEEVSMKGVEAEMVYLVSTITQSRAIPICRVETNGKIVYVDQSGKVYTKSAIIPQPYGR